MWKQYFPIYERLESEFCELTYSVALNDDHLKVHSILMSEFLLRICSECENISKSILNSKAIPERIWKNANFPKLGVELGKLFSLTGKELEVIWPYQELTKTSIKPFEDWYGSKNPTWYIAYNKIKHSRESEFKQSNYENCLASLAGLFILNLILRKDDIESKSQHIDRTRDRIKSYSKLFDPQSFLNLKNGLGTFRSLQLAV